MNINKKITAVSSGCLDGVGPGGKDVLLVGTATDLLAYDVDDNKDRFHVDVGDGVSALACGSTGAMSAPMAIIGGGSSVQGFDAYGEEVFWTVAGDRVGAVALRPSASGESGANDLLVGSDDFAIRTFPRGGGRRRGHGGGPRDAPRAARRRAVRVRPRERHGGRVRRHPQGVAGAEQNASPRSRRTTSTRTASRRLLPGGRGGSSRSETRPRERSCTRTPSRVVSRPCSARTTEATAAARTWSSAPWTGRCADTGRARRRTGYEEEGASSTRRPGITSRRPGARRRRRRKEGVLLRVGVQDEEQQEGEQRRRGGGVVGLAVVSTRAKSARATRKPGGSRRRRRAGGDARGAEPATARPADRTEVVRAQRGGDRGGGVPRRDGDERADSPGHQGGVAAGDAARARRGRARPANE